jgi:CubicO group peptidase (beta-lactamase class C family)
VHPAGSPRARSVLDELGSLIPAKRRSSACVIEIIPVGAFRTYGLGVSLRTMLNPAAAQARVPVTPDGGHPVKAPPGQAATGHPGSGPAAISSRHPAVGLAVSVVRDGHLRHFHRHGLADIVSRTPVTEDTVFRIGSITKTFTAIAVLQLCERGLIDLDAPAGGYLRSYRLIPAKPGHRPPTIPQLLTHTAGLPQLVYPARAVIKQAGCRRCRLPMHGFRPSCGSRLLGRGWLRPWPGRGS